jgi:hypothetical protein
MCVCTYINSSISVVSIVGVSIRSNKRARAHTHTHRGKSFLVNNVLLQRPGGNRLQLIHQRTHTHTHTHTHTGKSFLVNNVLLQRPGGTGFSVGSSVNACTKGLWLWSVPLAATAADGSSIRMIVIDTEGIGALDAHAQHDIKVFSLSLLLSSTFIFNSVGAIDEVKVCVCVHVCFVIHEA